MKRTRNILITVSVILMLAGIVIAAVAFSLSGFNASESSDLISTGERKEMKADFKNEFSNLIIVAEDRRIDFQKSDDGMIHLEYTESEKRKIEITESGGTLSFTEHLDYKWFDYFFNFDLNNKLTVKLPAEIGASISVDDKNGKITLANLSLNNKVDIKTSNGEINIADAIIKGGLTAQTSNGRIDISRLDAGERADLKTSNGEVSVQDFNGAKELWLKTSNGKVYLDKVKAEDITINSSNGKLEFWNTDVGKSLSAETSNGKIEGTLVGKPGDFSFTYDNEDNKCNLPLDGSGGKTAYFKTSNGNIDVSYAQ